MRASRACRRLLCEPDLCVSGYVYGGRLASLVDCHATGTASAAAERAEGRDIGAGPAPQFVTAQLNVTYLKPTLLGPELELRARVVERTPRKTVVAVTVTAEDLDVVRADVVAVPRPAHMAPAR